jgi:hypothetical protein
MHTHGQSRQPSRNLELHPGINFSSMDVGGDIGGLVFTAGSVVAVLIGLPSIAPLYLASVACGAVLAVAIFAWHERHHGH